jgi:pyridoxal phosphate enzyme (YggS family)
MRKFAINFQLFLRIRTRIAAETKKMTNNRSIGQNLVNVQELIAKSATAVNRPVSDIDLCAVSKTFPANQIRFALLEGQRIFGENRVQEADEKWPAFRAEFSDIELHLIGPLQTNKVRTAVNIFDVIQTLDRPKLATALAKEFATNGRSLPCYVQVNTGEEPQKAGISPSQTEAFVQQCRDEHNLNIIGLMCIPPHHEEPAPHFALLHDLASKIGLQLLSMGMSADFPIAIEFGATVVRVGSAIFGVRDHATRPHED